MPLRPRDLLVLLLATGMATAALAQDGPPGPPPLPYLLRLRPDQRPAWRAYSGELALERADAAHAASDASQLNAMTTPERLDWRLAHLPDAERQARRQATAVLAFYAQLDPAQRHAFDRVTRTPPPPVPGVSDVPPAPRGRTGPPLPQPPGDAPLPAPASR